jgi:3-deoxy-D-manno-octulosonate 8-phosphate phosphatase (KDO 8-P phosphatase)
MSAIERARAVRLMAFDVDGVLTDGRLYFGATGEETKAFHTRDGHGMKLLQATGVQLAIITGRSARAVELRAQNLGITRVRQGIEDKRSALAELAGSLGIDLAQCGYMGDDVVDLPVLRACGFSASVPDGHPLVRSTVDYVSGAPAGAGAVREVCEFILRAQGRLDEAMAPYLE